MEWDDLRYVLAVAEAGSLAGAARALGVNHTTVLRRITAFEATIGLRLFERLPTGYVLTAGGEELATAARGVRDTVTSLERRLLGQDLRLSGTLRVTTTDTLMATVLPGVLADFRAEQPGIVLELAVANAIANLSRRDADVAIRPSPNPPETLVGRRIAAIAFAIYGSPAYLSGHAAAGDLAGHRWVAPDDNLTGTTAAQWMRSELPESDVVLRADSLLALRQGAEAGLGLAALPCYLGDTSPGLIRVRPPVPAMETALWVLTHEDLRNTARIRAFTEFAATALGRHRDLLEGRAV